MTRNLDLEECSIAWFKQCKDCIVSIGGNMLKEKQNNSFQKSWDIRISKEIMDGWRI